MPLAGTEDALAEAMHAAATSADGDSKAAWKKVAKTIIAHITSNAVVTGVVPNGTIANGKVT
jgi:hypothetical protein